MVLPIPLKPYYHISLCDGSILVFHTENPPPTHLSLFFPLFSPLPLYNHCMNLHAWMSSFILELVFCLSLPLSLSFSFPPPPVVVHTDSPIRDLGCLQMDCKDGCTDVCLCACVCVGGGSWPLLQWPHCHRDEWPLPLYCASVCFVYLYQSRSRACTCACACQSHGSEDPKPQTEASLSLILNGSTGTRLETYSTHKY